MVVFVTDINYMATYITPLLPKPALAATFIPFFYSSECVCIVWLFKLFFLQFLFTIFTHTPNILSDYSFRTHVFIFSVNNHFITKSYLNRFVVFIFIFLFYSAGQKSKTQIETKLKNSTTQIATNLNSNCDIMLKLKLWQNLKFILWQNSKLITVSGKLWKSTKASASRNYLAGSSIGWSTFIKSKYQISSASVLNDDSRNRLTLLARLHSSNYEAIVTMSSYLLGSDYGGDVVLPPGARLWWGCGDYCSQSGSSSLRWSGHGGLVLVLQMSSLEWLVCPPPVLTRVSSMKGVRLSSSSGVLGPGRYLHRWHHDTLMFLTNINSLSPLYNCTTNVFLHYIKSLTTI